jgi:5-methylcytosine-specific restriction endonuclease McrA
MEELQKLQSQKALYINGVYEIILRDIISATSEKKITEAFLQPYKPVVIKLLKEEKPSPNNPIIVYFSTTTQLTEVSYIADIIGWEDKRELSENRKIEVEKLIKKNQPSEKNGLYLINDKGKPYVNLLKIRNLKKLNHSIPVPYLIKVSDGTPHKIRNQAGGWCQVFPLPVEKDQISYFTDVQVLNNLEKRIKESKELSNQTRLERLATAQKKPLKIQISSTGYQRNPDVIIEVLLRANGICERCHNIAPFLKASDGTPYLEVHHIIPLSEGGDDTVENAQALCPNCHREMHFGIM